MQSIILSYGETNMWFFDRKKKAKRLEAERIREDNLKRLDNVTAEIEKATKNISKEGDDRRDVTRMLFEATRGGKK